MSTSYPTKTAPDLSAVGTVRGREVRTYLIDVEASVDQYAVREADEIVIRLNGRPLKRMTTSQAIRAGVVTEDAR